MHILVVILCLCSASACMRESNSTASIRVAAASNLAEVAQELAERFEEESGHTALFSFASTQKLKIQISRGAPFDVFLAADVTAPAECVEEGHCDAEYGVLDYASGRLVVWSPQQEPGFAPTGLSQAEGVKIVMANPQTAPYGLAAEELLSVLDALPLAENRILAESAVQTYRITQQGLADTGIIAASHLRGEEVGDVWNVPEEYHPGIRQAAALTRHGTGNAGAVAFLDYLRTPEARDIFRRHGYDVPDD